MYLNIFIQGFLRGFFLTFVPLGQTRPSKDLRSGDPPIEGSACTGEMNQFSVSGHIQQTGSVHLFPPEGTTDAPLRLSGFLLSPQPHTHTHTHRLYRAPARTLITSGLSLSEGANASLMEQSRRTLPLYAPSPTPDHSSILRTNLIWRCRELIKPGDSVKARGGGR